VEPFPRQHGRLFCEGVDLEALVSEVGTPCYVYSAASIRDRYRALRDAFAPLDPAICFSVKSNSNLAVLDLLRREGAWFDVVSDGELHRTHRIGVDPARVVFAGVGKTDAELRAAIEAGVGYLNVESVEEFEAVERVAAASGRSARVLLRINPDVDAGTHRHITTGREENKFGIGFAEAAALLAARDRFPHVAPRGLHCHIGSQITSVEPYAAALARIAEFVTAQRSAGVPREALAVLDFGGGFGIEYREAGIDLVAVARAIEAPLRALEMKLLLEPGRFVVGAAGALLARVLYRKGAANRRFVIVDAGMTELLRPALYDAWHPVEVVAPRRSAPLETIDLVGPICESSDVLARGRELPRLEQGDLVAILKAGAYGFAMASNYNSRPRPPEVLVDGDAFRVVRARESLDDLLRGETV
jgi:diaminopimelate decarboxylase